MKLGHWHYSIFNISASAVLLTTVASSQAVKQDSLWEPLHVLIGSWKGTGAGEPGTGEYERTYRFVLNKKYIEVTNKSIYAPSEKKPNGEVHEDVGYFSYDKSRRAFVLRQFHIEGFVNQYAMESISGEGKRLVFVSEAIENIPAGWRARETYDVVDENQIEETFELARPNKAFEVYSKVKLKRIH